MNRLTNANANFGTAETFGATSRVSPTEAVKYGLPWRKEILIHRAKKAMSSLRTSAPNAFTIPVQAPPVPKLPGLYAAPALAPILKLNTQSSTASMSTLRIGSAIPSSPMTPALLNKESFSNLRTASTLTPTKSSSTNISPKTSRSNLRYQSTASNTPPPTISRNPSSTTGQSQLRHVSTIAPASILISKHLPSTSNKPSSFNNSTPSNPSKPQSPTKRRQIHTSKPTADPMLSDNVHLPTFTDEIPIEIPRVPILPQTQRAPPPIIIDTPQTEHAIITAAGAHTHPAPPGGGSDHAREHLQSDFTRRRAAKETEEQSGKFEGDWHGHGGDNEEGETLYRFVPEEKEIPVQDKGILWGIVGAATLWVVFGPGKKKGKK